MPRKGRTTEENQSVARALKILNLMADHAEPLGVREVARQLRVAPSIAHRLVKTLANGGFLEQTSEASRYKIGYKAFQIGNAFVGQKNLHAAVMPELYALAEQQINAFLGVLRDRSVIYLATVQSNEPVAITHRPGAQTYLHSTAMGKALLAEMSDENVRALLAHGPLPRLTPQTKTSMNQLLSDLHDVRRLGYAISDAENREGFFSVGSVIRDSTSRAIAVISGAIPRVNLTTRERAKIVRRVVDAARNASRKLGAPDAVAH